MHTQHTQTHIIPHTRARAISHIYFVEDDAFQSLDTGISTVMIASNDCHDGDLSPSCLSSVSLLLPKYALRFRFPFHSFVKTAHNYQRRAEHGIENRVRLNSMRLNFVFAGGLPVCTHIHICVRMYTYLTTVHDAKIMLSQANRNCWSGVCCCLGGSNSGKHNEMNGSTSRQTSQCVNIGNFIKVQHDKYTSIWFFGLQLFFSKCLFEFRIQLFSYREL